MFYADSDLVVVTYALSDLGSFREATQYWVQEVADYSPASRILLLGNKLDEKRAVPEESIADFVQKSRCLEAKVSCKMDQNVRPTWRLISHTLIDEFGSRAREDASLVLDESTHSSSIFDQQNCRC